MAQSRVTEFFNTRKKQSGYNASKRRKIQATEDDVISATIATEPAKPQRRTTRSSKVQEPVIETAIVSETTVNEKTKQTVKIRSNTRTTTRKSTRTRNSKTKQSAPSIRDAFDSINLAKSSETESKTNENKEVAISEETTAVCDDHPASPRSTPTKRNTTNGASESTLNGKRSKKSTSVRKDLLNDDSIKTPEQGYDFSRFVEAEKQPTPVARKRLFLKSNKAQSTPINQEAEKLVPQDENNEVVPEQASEETSQNEAKAEPKEELSPKESQSKEDKETANDDPKQNEVNSKPSTSNTNKQQKLVLDPNKVKEKLMKCGKLKELQEKLAKFNEAEGKLKKIQKAKEEQAAKTEETEKKAPAYERFHSLAKPIPPTLSLPYRYQLLLEMFRSMETAVSMLYNRSETCTFSKIKTAVQTMIRRDFELKTVQQIKTTHPTAYIFRQEKGLPCNTGKTNSYQLTAEPVIEKSENTPAETAMTSSGRTLFTASHLLERKNFFHQSLINMVKSHHKKFLASLQRPLTVPDDKITRWHPGFALDEVPDVDCAELPEPPVTKSFSSAKDVLNHTRTELPNRVRKVLEKVAGQAEEKDRSKTPETNSAQKAVEPKTPSTPATSNQGNTAVKGISQSLLDKIRAKEAKKNEEKMMRNPQEDKRTLMLSRLIEFTKILRSVFVQEKKPALPVDLALKKLGDSCRSAMSTADLEAHVKLMHEVLPDWISTVTVRQGKFLKIDRNKDVSTINERINKLIKQSS